MPAVSSYLAGHDPLRHRQPGASVHLKRSAIHDYYSQAVENSDKAIMEAANTLNAQRHHPLRLRLRTVLLSLQAA